MNRLLRFLVFGTIVWNGQSSVITATITDETDDISTSNSNLQNLFKDTLETFQNSVKKKCGIILISIGITSEPSQFPSYKPSNEPRITAPSSNPSGRPSTILPMAEWSQVGNDINGKQEDEEFGRCIAISGNGERIAIGGNNGVMRIYDLGAAGWSIPVEITGFINSGYAVSTLAMSNDGNFIVVSSCGYDTAADIGEVTVFEFVISVGGWKVKGSSISEGNPSDLFGYSVDISDDGQLIIIGAPGGTSPYVRIATIGENSNWAGVRVDDTKTGFGTSVSMSSDGQTAFIGATEGNGSVSVYDLLNLFTPDVEVLTGNGEGFGAVSALSADGTTIAVGTSNGDYVKVFSKSASGSWAQLGNDIIGESGSSFGQSLSISGDGNRLAIGAKTQRATSGFDGQVFLYDVSKESFFGIFDAESDSNFASSVAISDDGSNVAISASTLDVDGDTNTGQVQVFRYARP